MDLVHQGQPPIDKSFLRFQKFIENVTGKKLLSTTSISDAEKDRAWDLALSRKIEVGNVRKNGVVKELPIFDISDLVLPNEWESVIPSIGEVDEQFRVPLLKTIYYMITNTIGYNNSINKYQVQLLPYTVLICTILATGALPQITFRLKVCTIQDTVTNNLLGAQFRTKSINDLTTYLGTQPTLFHYKTGAARMFVYTMLLLLRKSRFTNISLGVNTIDADATTELHQISEKLHTHAMHKVYGLVEITNITIESIFHQYVHEHLTVDGYILYTLYTGLMDSSMAQRLNHCFQCLDAYIVTDKPYPYVNGDLMCAYSWCASIIRYIKDFMPHFVFSKGFGHPERLSQFAVVREAAEDMKVNFPTGIGVSRPVYELIQELENLFQSYPLLLTIYHEGHPEFVVPGKSAKVLLEYPLRILKTLGLAQEHNDSDYAAINNIPYDGKSWLKKPLFKDVVVCIPEVGAYAKALKSIYADESQYILNIMRESISLTSTKGTWDVKPITFKDLLPRKAAEEQEQQHVDTTQVQEDIIEIGEMNYQ